MSFVRRLMRDTAGATAIEYSLMAALIGALLVGVVTSVGQGVQSKLFNNIANATQ